jgi:hypothetical protein
MKTQLRAKTLVPALLASMMLLAGATTQAAQNASEHAAAQLLSHDEAGFYPVSNAAYFDAHAAAERLLAGNAQVTQRASVGETTIVPVNSPRYDAHATAVRLLTSGTTAAPASEAAIEIEQRNKTATAGTLGETVD